MTKEKQTPEEKKEDRKALVALDRLIALAKAKGAFISEEIIKQEPPKQTTLFDQ